MSDTLRGGISDTVNELEKIRGRVTDVPTLKNLQKIINRLLRDWETVIEDQFDKTTQHYADAVAGLNSATQIAKDAIADATKVVAAINAAVKAIKAVETAIALAAKFVL